jgi:hypothetical protein
VDYYANAIKKAGDAIKYGACAWAGGCLRFSLGLATQPIDFALQIVSALLRLRYCETLLAEHFLHGGIRAE